MLLVSEAEAIILDLAASIDLVPDVEKVTLLAATGRVLANSITSDLDVPHWDNSAMDGYAVRYEDIRRGACLDVVEEIKAGCQPQIPLKAGQAARILTGSMMPEGADTVVMQEVARREEGQVFILEVPDLPGEFVRKKGEYYRAGELLLKSGTVLGAPEIAVLAAVGCQNVPVYRQPRVAIFSTGNELVAPGESLQPGQIVDSNQYALAAAVQKIGAVPVLLGIVEDDPIALKNIILSASKIADIVLSTGGVSVGDYDYVEEVLSSLGGKIKINSVAIKPGKPLTVATLQNPVTEKSLLYFGLPGNPVSTLVTFWRFVQPAIKKISGISHNLLPTFLMAKTLSDLRSDGKRESYLWGKLTPTNNPSKGELFQFALAEGSHSSANLINLAITNSLAVLPIGTKLIPGGMPVKVLPISM